MWPARSAAIVLVVASWRPDRADVPDGGQAMFARIKDLVVRLAVLAAPVALFLAAAAPYLRFR